MVNVDQIDAVGLQIFEPLRQDSQRIVRCVDIRLGGEKNFVAAPPHDHSFQFTRTLDTSLGVRAYTDQLYWISFATLAGLPATAAPVGRTADRGLPVGIQIVGPYLEDATSIDIAAKMADVIGGFEAPAGYL
ncbi:MAG: hypothetical protein IH936_08890 [Acidobacteria bacterium]|nr:hypothetical protein [Acidobacteriota bacterium]